jgi:hypothetical protein
VSGSSPMFFPDLLFQIFFIPPPNTHLFPCALAPVVCPRSTGRSGDSAGACKLGPPCDTGEHEIQPDPSPKHAVEQTRVVGGHTRGARWAVLDLPVELGDSQRSDTDRRAARMSKHPGHRVSEARHTE